MTKRELQKKIISLRAKRDELYREQSRILCLVTNGGRELTIDENFELLNIKQRLFFICQELQLQLALFALAEE